MNLRRLKELPCKSTPIYSRVFLERCGVVSSCARRRKRRDPVTNRQRPKTVWGIRWRQTVAIFLALLMGSYEKSETEDLLKLDGRNLSSCGHQAAQSTGVTRRVSHNPRTRACAKTRVNLRWVRDDSRAAFLTRGRGKGANYKEIDVTQEVQAMWMHKCQGLLGLHHFTRAGWGENFVGITKTSCVTAYIVLEDDHLAIDCFRELDEHLIQTLLANRKGPTQDKDVEEFVCQVCWKVGPKLRWELFRRVRCVSWKVRCCNHARRRQSHARQIPFYQLPRSSSH